MGRRRIEISITTDGSTATFPNPRMDVKECDRPDHPGVVDEAVRLTGTQDAKSSALQLQLHVVPMTHVLAQRQDESWPATY